MIEKELDNPSATMRSISAQCYQKYRASVLTGTDTEIGWQWAVPEAVESKVKGLLEEQSAIFHQPWAKLLRRRSRSLSHHSDGMRTEGATKYPLPYVAKRAQSHAPNIVGELLTLSDKTFLSNCLFLCILKRKALELLKLIYNRLEKIIAAVPISPLPHKGTLIKTVDSFQSKAYPV